MIRGRSWWCRHTGCGTQGVADDAATARDRHEIAAHGHLAASTVRGER